MPFLRRKVNGCTGWAGLKLDMTKAYYKMEWGFVRSMLLNFGFDNKWVSLIMLCVESAAYNFKVNNKLIGLITLSRGLREGDLFSPYIFILCAEGL